jgi:sulfite exporter TauE/SafE
VTSLALLRNRRYGVARWSLLIAGVAGVSLAALFWYTGVLDADFVGRWQAEVTGARSGPGLAVAVALAFAVGASMVVLPCGFPAVFAVPSLLEREPSSRARLRSLVAFTVGGVLPLALAGALLGLLGGGLWDSLDSAGSRQVFAAIVYSILGVVALAYALTQLGVGRMQGAFVRLAGPDLLTDGKTPRSSTRRPAMLGATFGAGLGIACPMPTYYAVLAWVVVAASPWYGAVVLGAYGLGRVAPAIAVGMVIVGGASRRGVSQRLVALHGRVEWGSAVVTATLGVFLIALFGGFIGTSLI